MEQEGTSPVDGFRGALLYIILHRIDCSTHGGGQRGTRQPPNSLTLTDADAVTIACRRLVRTSHKFSIPGLNCASAISTTITRLKTMDLKEMNTSPDGHQNYKSFPRCIDIKLSYDLILDCPGIVMKAFKIHVDPMCINFSILARLLM